MKRLLMTALSASMHFSAAAAPPQMLPAGIYHMPAAFVSPGSLFAGSDLSMPVPVAADRAVL